MNTNLSNQIATADWILTKIEKIDPFAIITGGAPRDWEHGMMARDVDIFLNVPNSWTIGVIARQLNNVCGIRPSAFKGEERMQWYEKNPDIRAVFDWRHFGVDFQFIIVNKPVFDYHQNFPLSICQVMRKNFNTKVTTDFNASKNTKEIYITNKLYNNADTYVAKVVSKYKDMGYSFVGTKEDFARRLITKASQS
jgi:hypothetical protein